MITFFCDADYIITLLQLKPLLFVLEGDIFELFTLCLCRLSFAQEVFVVVKVKLSAELVELKTFRFYYNRSKTSSTQTSFTQF